jgi:hypothetical protein
MGQIIAGYGIHGGIVATVALLIHYLPALDSVAIAITTLTLRALSNTTPMIFSRVKVIAPVPIRA